MRTSVARCLTTMAWALAATACGGQRLVAKSAERAVGAAGGGAAAVASAEEPPPPADDEPTPDATLADDGPLMPPREWGLDPTGANKPRRDPMGSRRRKLSTTECVGDHFELGDMREHCSCIEADHWSDFVDSSDLPFCPTLSIDWRTDWNIDIRFELLKGTVAPGGRLEARLTFRNVSNEIAPLVISGGTMPALEILAENGSTLPLVGPKQLCLDGLVLHFFVASAVWLTPGGTIAIDLATRARRWQLDAKKPCTMNDDAAPLPRGKYRASLGGFFLRGSAEPKAIPFLVQ